MKQLVSREFYRRPTVQVARELIGMTLVRTLVSDGRKSRLSGTIVEAEAYGGANDPASHARMGPTARNSVMFGQVGRAYVYFTYGNHFCINVSARSSQPAGAVLIRAIKPLEGIEIMMSNRAQQDIHSVASGPGRLCRAMEVDASLNGADMASAESEIFVEHGQPPMKVLATPRIGITRATRRCWRFIDPTSLHLSRKIRIKIR